MSSFEKSILPRLRGANVEIFYGSLVTTNVILTGWRTWTRPKNASMVFIVCQGSGAGGGGGLTGASLTARGGGAGGGSGALSRLVIAAHLLPRRLYLLPGCGGAGGAASTAGASGQISAVVDTPAFLATSARTILQSGGARAPAPGAGTAGGSTAGGAAETIVTTTSCPYTGLALPFFIAGQAGSASGALGGAGVAVTWGSNGIPVSGGAGGGSVSVTDVDGAGGAITGAGLIPSIAGGLAAGGAGNNGWDLESPWLGTGGAGGGSFGTGTAGRGGDGAPGCGGGGGGGGVTGGAGGNGGPGWILIGCF